jgi:UDP-glucose 4-epimerase
MSTSRRIEKFGPHINLPDVRNGALDGPGLAQANRCLVTGGTGFIGSHLVRKLVSAGCEVRVLARRSVHPNSPNDTAVQPRTITGDFCDPAVVREALEGVDTVFHYATTTKPASAPGISLFDAETNLIGTMRLFELCSKANVARIIFASSGGTVYGVTGSGPIRETCPCNPICSHGIIKLALEHYVSILARESNISYTVLRYANPYGPLQRPDGKQGAVAAFASKIIRNEEITIWGDGRTVRDYIFIDDLIDATVASVWSDGALNQTINIGGGAGLSLNSLILRIEQVVGRKAVVRHLPPRGFDVPSNVLAIDKAQALLGWRPSTPLLVGLKRTTQWLSDYWGGAASGCWVRPLATAATAAAAN